MNWFWLMDIWLSCSTYMNNLSYVTPSMLCLWRSRSGKISFRDTVLFLTYSEQAGGRVRLEGAREVAFFVAPDWFDQ